ncbi:MAG: DUF58 domain-containing protein [Dehalococcoidia bacterium]
MSDSQSQAIPRDILRKVRRIEIRTRKLVNESLAGGYHSVFKGQGMEFSEVREYQFGDDVRSIDWNVTSRMGRPFVKKYKEERELTVVLVVDASASGTFGSAEQVKSEVMAEICALLAFSAIRNNDRVGLILFTDRVEKFVPPAKGQRHVLRVIREILFHRPVGRGTDLNGALEYLGRVIRRRAVVFLVSDFLTRDFERSLRLVNRVHDLVALSVRDPRESELPAVGMVALEDAETGAVQVVDTGLPRLRRAFREAALEAQERLRDMFRRLGIDTVELANGEPYDVPLVRFFKERARRAR